MIPNSKPRLSEHSFLKIAEKHEIFLNDYPVILIGIRGYYLDSMGVKKKNDRKVYDDACAWVSRDGCQTFNFNVDPNGYRKGSGFGSGKGMANLKTGVWKYQKGLHRGYPAFRQAAAVTVLRDGFEKSYPNTGWFGINIHRGGQWGTSSLGCQTLPKSQWKAFKELGYFLLSKYEQKTFPYILVDEIERRKY